MIWGSLKRNTRWSVGGSPTSWQPCLLEYAIWRRAIAAPFLFSGCLWAHIKGSLKTNPPNSKPLATPPSLSHFQAAVRNKARNKAA
jgi:hypothetical protein